MSTAFKPVSKYGKGIAGLWKQGWCEIPEIMSTTGLALGSFLLALHGLYRIEREGLDKRRFRYEYTVYRHDDPRVPEINMK